MIISWANDKNFVEEKFAPKQRLKLIEECGELAGAILKNKVDEQKDAIGDIFVVLVILQKQYDENYKFELDKVPFSEDVDTCLINIISDSVDCDGIDICFIWLFELSLCINQDLTECANLAWNEIKNRTGKTVDGTFIKDDVVITKPQFPDDRK